MTANLQGIELTTLRRGKVKERSIAMHVTVDGESRRVLMGVQHLTIRPGRHEISLRLPTQWRAAKVTVDVPEDGIVRLHWHIAASPR